MCAGPYSLALLGIGPELSDRFQAELELKADNEVLRPGHVRLSLPYFVHPAALDFVLQACRQGRRAPLGRTLGAPQRATLAPRLLGLARLALGGAPHSGGATSAAHRSEPR